MLDTITAVCLAITDWVLGWLLYLPRDVGLVVLTLGTAFLLVGVRVFTTNQDLLRRCQADKMRIKALIREAKKNRDKAALTRYHTTLHGIAMKTLKAEGKPLLVSLLPIALVATWAYSRITYLPVRDGETFAVRLYTPLSAIGQWAHIVPQAGLQSESGWIREVKEDTPATESPATESPATESIPAANGVAEWVLRGDKRLEPYEMLIRLKGRTITAAVLVDGVHYADPPQRQYGEDPTTEVVEVVLAEYKPLGIVPGWSAALLPPWIIGYLLLVIPVTLLLKPLLRIR